MKASKFIHLDGPVMMLHLVRVFPKIGFVTPLILHSCIINEPMAFQTDGDVLNMPEGCFGKILFQVRWKILSVSQGYWLEAVYTFRLKTYLTKTRVSSLLAS